MLYIVEIIAPNRHQQAKAEIIGPKKHMLETSRKGSELKMFLEKSISVMQFNTVTTTPQTTCTFLSHQSVMCVYVF